MNPKDWRQVAIGMLEIERRMQPLHNPPSTGCLVTWRDRVLVGMVQYPVHPQFPAVVFLSVTSKYVHPDYIAAIREAAPGRLELQADADLDLQGNFHVLRRVDDRLMYMTPAETRAMVARRDVVVQVQPREDGIEFRAPVTAFELKVKERPS